MATKTYAHLLSSVQAAAKEVPGDKDAKPMGAAESEPENDEMDNKKSKKAKAKVKSKKMEDESEDREEKDDEQGEKDESEDDREEEEEDEREDKEDKKSKKAKKAKASASVSSEELQAARLEERLRCAQIFQSKAAAGKPDLAARFAFHTDLSAETATMLMEGFSAEKPASAKRPSIDERMARVQNANVGSDFIEHEQSSFVSVSEQQLSKMSSDQKALMIVNASRALRGEAALTKLPN